MTTGIRQNLKWLLCCTFVQLISMESVQAFSLQTDAEIIRFPWALDAPKTTTAQPKQEVEIEYDVSETDCLSLSSFSYRAEVIRPVLGPELAFQRASFTIASPTCGDDDSNLALYVVFSSPNSKNKTYEYKQEELAKLKADKFEVAVEATQWLQTGDHGVEI